MNDNKLPEGWNGERVKKVLEHYEGQTDDQAAAEDEADLTEHPETVFCVPINLVPAVRELIGKQQSSENQ